MSHAGGYAGDKSDGRKIEGVAANMEHRPDLASGGSVTGQAKSLDKFLKGDPDELNWDDTMISGVTDKARELVVEHLDKHMKDVLAKMQLATPSADEVLAIKQDLEQMRTAKKAVASQVEKNFRQLRGWNITEDLLRKTKIGVEVADKFWRDKNAPEKMRKMSKSLVDSWKEKVGLKNPASGVFLPPDDFFAALLKNNRKIKNLSVELELAIYNAIFQQQVQTLGAGFGHGTSVGHTSGMYSKHKKVISGFHVAPGAMSAHDDPVKYKTLALRVRKWLETPNIGARKLRELAEGVKDAASFVNGLHELPESYFSGTNQLVGPAATQTPAPVVRTVGIGIGAGGMGRVQTLTDGRETDMRGSRSGEYSGRNSRALDKTARGSTSRGAVAEYQKKSAMADEDFEAEFWSVRESGGAASSSAPNHGGSSSIGLSKAEVALARRMPLLATTGTLKRPTDPADDAFNSAGPVRKSGRREGD